MIEPIKVMMDEQTKVALKQLEGALADLLSPLKKLDEGGGDSDGMQVQQIVGEIRKLSHLLEDALEDVKRKLSDVCDNQAELFRKVAELSARQASASVVTVTSPQRASAPDVDTKASAKKTPVTKKVKLAMNAPKAKKPVKKPVPVKPGAKKAEPAKAAAPKAKKPVKKPVPVKSGSKKAEPAKVAAPKRASVKPAVKKVKKSR